MTKQFGNAKNANNILLVVIASIAGICMCCLGGSILTNLAPTPVEATLNPLQANTAIAKTFSAAILQTSAVNTPTLVFTSTLASSPTFELPTETPTFILLATPPQISGSGANLPLNTFCVPNAAPQTGKVVHVTDGDTIKVKMDGDGETYTVRYIGIDTPENTSTVEYYGPEATVKNSELVSGKQVTLYKDVSETDRYGRLLRYVFVGDIFVNYELVSQGYASSMRYPPDTACADYFEQSERIAAASGIGMWAVVPLFTTPTVIFGAAPCSCSSNQYNCSDFGTHAKAQACYDYCKSIGAGDVHKMDGDNNGIACEALP
jgi:micrococcal nuclease